MKTVKINIQDYDSRMRMIVALAVNRYKVWQEVEKPDTNKAIYWICLEIPEENIKDL